jgi:hypothetical protein
MARRLEEPLEPDGEATLGADQVVDRVFDGSQVQRGLVDVKDRDVGYGPSRRHPSRTHTPHQGCGDAAGPVRRRVSARY